MVSMEIKYYDFTKSSHQPLSSRSASPFHVEANAWQPRSASRNVMTADKGDVSRLYQLHDVIQGEWLRLRTEQQVSASLTH